MSDMKFEIGFARHVHRTEQVFQTRKNEADVFAEEVYGLGPIVTQHVKETREILFELSRMSTKDRNRAVLQTKNKSMYFGSE